MATSHWDAPELQRHAVYAADEVQALLNTLTGRIAELERRVAELSTGTGATVEAAVGRAYILAQQAAAAAAGAMEETAGPGHVNGAARRPMEPAPEPYRSPRWETSLTPIDSARAMQRRLAEADAEYLAQHRLAEAE